MAESEATLDVPSLLTKALLLTKETPFERVLLATPCPSMLTLEYLIEVGFIYRQHKCRKKCPSPRLSLRIHSWHEKI